MVIVHLVNNDGGVGSVVHNLANEQVKRGHKVYVYTAIKDAQFIVKLDRSVVVRDVAVRYNKPMLFGNDIRKVYTEVVSHNKRNKVVIHAHNLLTIGMMSRTKRIPLVCTIHGISTFPQQMKTLRGFLQTYAINRTIHNIVDNDGIVVGVSKRTTDFYSSRSHRNIYTIYNGSRRLGTKAEVFFSFTIVHIGDVSTNKGWDTEYEAFLMLREKYSHLDIRFITAGRCCDISEQTLRLYEKKTEGAFSYLGLVDNVQEKVLSKASVMTLMSLSEGLPMSIVESFEAMVPVIATSVGGIPEIVDDSVNGYLINKSSTELCEKLELLLKNEDVLEKMRMKAYEKYRAMFSLEKMYDSYIQLYKKVSVKNGSN